MQYGINMYQTLTSACCNNLMLIHISLYCTDLNLHLHG